MYIDQGKNQWGIRVHYLLVTNHAGYMHNMLAYSGKKAPLIQQPTLFHTTNVVFLLPEYLKGKDMTKHTTSL